MSPIPETLQIACLCAAWCRTCDAYGSVLRQVVGELAAEGRALQARWIDIEDEAELLGDLDIETFPTLVVFDAQRVRFAGPLTPQPETLRRLLRSLLAEPSARAAVGAEIEAFVQRLRDRAAA